MAPLDHVDGISAQGRAAQEQTDVSQAKAISQDMQAENIDDESWFVTLCFLIGLVLFGAITGYLIRGGSSQTQDFGLSVPSPLVSIVQDDTRLAISTDQPETITFGSDAPDEMLSLQRRMLGQGYIGLVKTHNTRMGGQNRLSFVRVSDTGLVEETELMLGAALGESAIIDTPGGVSLVALTRSDEMEIQAIDSVGHHAWKRTFAMLPEHAGNIDLAALPNGSVTIGPGESADRVTVVHLGQSGQLVWQRSFEAHSEHPDVHIAAGAEDTFFVLMRSQRPDEVDGSYNLLRMDVEGQLVWKRPIRIGLATEIAGFEVSDQGNIFILISGSVPSLSKFDQEGERVWISALPNVSQQDTLHLVPGQSDDMIVASPYSLLGQRLYISMQHWDSFGGLIGTTELSLPEDSTLDVLSRASSGVFIVAGSVLPNRYDDADIYFKQATLSEADWVRPSVSDQVILSFEGTEGEAVKVAASSVPSKALLKEEAVAVASDAKAIKLASTAPVKLTEAVQTPVASVLLPSQEDDRAAARSTFVDAESFQKGQCRFTCLEQRGGATFPMWASVEGPSSGFEANLRQIHAQVCSTARGRIYKNIEPDCRIMGEGGETKSLLETEVP